MYLRQLFETTQSTTSDEDLLATANGFFKKNFDDVDISHIEDQTVVISNDLVDQPRARFNRLPFPTKFKSPDSGMCSLGSIDLTSTKNLPPEGHTLWIEGADKLSRLEGLNEYNTIQLIDCGIDSLENFPIVQTLKLNDLKNLKSFEGLNVSSASSIKISVKKCENIGSFDGIPLLKQQGEVSVTFSDHEYPRLPWLRPILFKDLKEYNAINVNFPSSLNPILDKYAGRGMSKAVELAIALKTNGFGQHSKF